MWFLCGVRLELGHWGVRGGHVIGQCTKFGVQVSQTEVQQVCEFYVKSFPRRRLTPLFAEVSLFCLTMVNIKETRFRQRAEEKKEESGAGGKRECNCPDGAKMTKHGKVKPNEVARRQKKWTCLETDQYDGCNRRGLSKKYSHSYSVSSQYYVAGADSR